MWLDIKENPPKANQEMLLLRVEKENNKIMRFPLPVYFNGEYLYCMNFHLLSPADKEVSFDRYTHYHMISDCTSLLSKLDNE